MFVCLLSLLRRRKLFPPTSTLQTALIQNRQRHEYREMSSPIEIYEQIHNILFPGEKYTPHRKAELGNKLRELAENIDNPIAITRRKSKKTGRVMDFSRYQQRYVALQFLYLGHDYYGFARQDTVSKTIEETLFTALRKVCLIEEGKTWQELKYSRGGRTDKGVSALGQVVALQLRSSGKVGEPVISEDDEFDYTAVLNRVLPPEIRVLGWATVPEDFSARFSTTFREYKYFIVTKEGALNVDKMREAAHFLLGEHDFRHFCKIDMSSVRSFTRKIMEVRLDDVGKLEWASGRHIVEFHIKGTAFLWHQIRCIAAVLLMVGRGLEDPSIVEAMLDLKKTPRKPLYPLASEEPLLFYNCWYPGLSFRRSRKAYEDVLKCMDDFAARDITRAAMIGAMEEKMMMDDVEEAEHDAKRLCASELKHVPLLERLTEPTVEERLAAMETRNREKNLGDDVVKE